MAVSWLIVPTLVYALLTYKVVNTLLLAAIAVGLKFAQARPEVPADARPYLPLLQIVVVFIFLGGNVVVVALVVAAAVAAYSQRDQIFKALEPWWQIQQRMPLTTRRLIAVALSLVVGYWFGTRATGNEWTYSFLSIVIATIITSLLVFTPSNVTRGGLT